MILLKMLIDNKKNAGRAHSLASWRSVRRSGTLPIFTVPICRQHSHRNRTGQLPEPFSDIICQPHLVSLPKETRTGGMQKWTGLLGSGRRSFKMNLEVKKGKGKKLENYYNHSPEYAGMVHHWASKQRGTIHAINPLGSTVLIVTTLNSRKCPIPRTDCDTEHMRWTRLYSHPIPIPYH